MRNFRTYVNDPAGNDPASANFLGATNINNNLTELENAVTRAGLTLTTDDGTADPDLTQLAESLFLHGVKSTSFQAAGTVDAITLTPVSGSSGVLIPDSYDNLEGARITFIPTGTNTTAVTVSIGQTGGTQLGTKKALDEAGAELGAGTLTATRTEFIFDPAADSANGAWILVPWTVVASTGAFSSQLLHVQDQKSTGTNGGSSTIATITRVLNTVLTNEISGASLSTNQITLPAGTYYIDASAPMYQVAVDSENNNKVLLYNISDASAEIIGTSEATFSAASSRSVVTGRFTIAGTKTFELRHISSKALTDGLGRAAGGGVIEVYADVKIWKVG